MTHLYIMNNNSQKYYFRYEKNIVDAFHFQVEEKIENFLIGEVIVGILPQNIKENLEKYILKIMEV